MQLIPVNELEQVRSSKTTSSERMRAAKLDDEKCPELQARDNDELKDRAGKLCVLVQTCGQ